MALRKEIELTWQGKDYGLTVTYDVIQKIDNKVNIGKLLLAENEGETTLTDKSNFVSAVLQVAGVEVTPEDVYEEMLGIDAVTVNTVYANALWATLPESKKKDQ